MSEASKEGIPENVRALIRKIDQIRGYILDFYSDMDLDLASSLLIQCETDLKQCRKIAPDLLEFFRNRKYFKNKNELVKFGQKYFNYKIKATLRREIEKELASFANSHNYSVEKLNALIKKTKSSGKTILKKSSRQKTSSSKSNVSRRYIDQTQRWVSLSISDLEKELNDKSKYPTITAIKKSANSILSSSQKKIKNRNKLIKIIIDYFKNLDALSKFGS